MTSGTRDLIGDIWQQRNLPDILAERCVHAVIETASCRSCVEVCPQSAWLLDDDALRLNQAVCDGCGLCLPACPEGAILGSQEIVIGQWQKATLALCACEFAQSTNQKGVIPCLHAVGLQDILRLYEKGVFEIVVATADCDLCERGKGIRLSDRLDALNNALRQSGLPDVRISHRSISEWQQLQQELSEDSIGPPLSRRGFLKGFLNTSLQQGLELFNLFSDQQAAYTPPGRLLPHTDAKMLWPNLPAVDCELCNGCDACAKLCPHHAIRMIDENGQHSYRINPQDCSGCGICVDICDQQAVRLGEWEVQNQQEIRLTSVKCSCCGNPFHLPTDQVDNIKVVCRICAQRNHHRNLYQVLS